jgi:hypothetical protein
MFRPRQPPTLYGIRGARTGHEAVRQVHLTRFFTTDKTIALPTRAAATNCRNAIGTQPFAETSVLSEYI